MRPRSAAPRTGFRRAVAVSAVLHVLAAGVFLPFLRTDPRAPKAPHLDTRAPEVRMALADVVPETEVAPPAPVEKPQPAKPPATEIKPPAVIPPKLMPPVAPRPDPPHAGPFSTTAPRTLPKEIGALLRKPRTQPAAMLDPNVKPAGATTGAKPTGARPMHGAFKPGQTVVYVLDCSGSMGASGKFAGASAALAATLAQQPEGVKFQVIVYDATARTLLPSDGTTMPATGANVRAAADKLAALEPRGRSNHLVAVRAALAFRPDVLVLLTDAEELTLAGLKPVLGSGAKPAVCLALATADGVLPPRELK